MKVVVLKGGRSSEHDVSLASAAFITEQLRQNGHNVTEILISKGGEWSSEGSDTLQLLPGGGLLGADVVFPAMHGPYGEDGVIQGALDVLDVPYVGSNVSASALCMDKLDLKDLLGMAKLPQVNYTWVGTDQWRRNSQAAKERISKLGLPVFVKPARLGSSVGISKVTTEVELEPAIELALKHDSVAVVEAMAPGVEVECAILGTIDPAASVPGEIVVKKGDWYDYEAKYSADGMELIIPARISDAAAAKVQALALDAFHRAGCSGLARIDFFVDGDSVLINEVNTMPGFTATSAYPKLLEATGITPGELLERLLEDALRKHEFEHSFQH